MVLSFHEGSNMSYAVTCAIVWMVQNAYRTKQTYFLDCDKIVVDFEDRIIDYDQTLDYVLSRFLRRLA